jgi:hypothetical protein
MYKHSYINDRSTQARMNPKSLSQPTVLLDTIQPTLPTKSSTTGDKLNEPSNLTDCTRRIITKRFSEVSLQILVTTHERVGQETFRQLSKDWSIQNSLGGIDRLDVF